MKEIWDEWIIQQRIIVFQPLLNTYDDHWWQCVCYVHVCMHCVCVGGGCLIYISTKVWPWELALCDAHGMHIDHNNVATWHMNKTKYILIGFCNKSFSWTQYKYYDKWFSVMHTDHNGDATWHTQTISISTFDFTRYTYFEHFKTSCVIHITILQAKISVESTIIVVHIDFQMWMVRVSVTCTIWNKWCSNGALHF